MPGSLRVRALFDHAWHLQTEQGDIATVSTAPYQGPLSVRIGLTSLRELGVAVGDEAAIHFSTRAYAPTEGGVLTIGPISIRLLSGRAWQPHSEDPPGPVNYPHDAAYRRIAPTTSHSRTLEDPLPVLAGRLSSNVASIVAQVRVTARGGLAADVLLGRLGIGAPAWLRRGAAEARGLQQALRALDPPGIRSRIGGLIGLGPGLTPSGDDLVCGLLAGLHVFALRSPGLRSRLETSRAIIAASVQDSAHRTTALSRTLLHYAARGVAVEPLLRVLWSLGSGRGVDALDELLCIGHSSGSDMLTGAVIAAMAVVGWEEASAPALVTSA